MQCLEISADGSPPEPGAPEESSPYPEGSFQADPPNFESRSPHPPKVLRAGTDLGRLLGERYVVLDWIGRGGMADVFLARDAELGQLVAVKVLAQELRGIAAYRERMLREADIALSIEHPNVVRTLRADIARDGTPFIVLEALVGETLHDYLERHGSMTQSDALVLLRELGEGLRAVHAAGIVHGDIKPKNVFLCGPLDHPHTAKLIDFGLSRPAGGEGSPLDEETIAGTLEYLAPEQAVADAVDSRSDIYAFGVVAFRWLTGELPFETHLGTQLLVHQLVSPAPPLSWLNPEVPPALEALVLVAMRKAKENRYQSMDALLLDLEGIAEGEAVILGAPIATYPDEYHPETALGRRALEVLKNACHERLRLPSVA